MNHSEMSSASNSHKHSASELPPVRIAIITVSDTRTEETDINGKYLKQQIIESGMLVSSYHIVHDEPAEIEILIEALIHSDSQILLFNGGTGVSKRDTTFDIVAQKLTKTLPGFGEIFRMISYKQIGPAAMLSRAIAGICAGKVIFSTPGSPDAVQLAWEKLIAPEIKHLVWEINR